MNFQQQLSDMVDQVNHALLDRLPGKDVNPTRIHEAIRHSAEAGGKRLRPVLTIAAHALHRNGRDPMPAALAIECIHTYSLIHDDLPAMDDSDMRRGRITCHKAFDEATAILAGDALQPMASKFWPLPMGKTRQSRLTSCICLRKPLEADNWSVVKCKIFFLKGRILMREI